MNSLVCVCVCAGLFSCDLFASFSARSSVSDSKSNADLHRNNFSNASLCGTNGAHQSIESSNKTKNNRKKTHTHTMSSFSLTPISEKKKLHLFFLNAEYI